MLSKYFTAVFATVAAASATGWTVPEGQKDGRYSVSVDANGKATHTYVGPVSGDAPAASEQKAPVDSAKFRLAKRGYHVDCGGYGLNNGDMDGATQGIRNQCNQGIYVNPNLDFYTIVGSVVCYYCDYNHGSVCSAAEFGNVLGYLNAVCGRYSAGWVVYDSHGQYGCEKHDAQFCGRGP